MSATTRGPLDLEIREEILTGLMREAHREFLETRYPGIPLGDWKAGRVRRVNGQLTSVKTLKFAVKPGTFICFDANTEQFKESRVRARDMVKGVLDNYHQSLSELREIAYYEVHNEDVGKAMQNAALLLGKGEPRSFEKVYEICPGSDGWNELRFRNPFIIGVEKMLEEYAVETGNASIEKVVISFEDEDNDYDSTAWNDYDSYLSIHLRR